MFQHLATTRASRLAYGELTGWQFYPIQLPAGFALTAAWADALRNKNVLLSGNALPNNSIVLVKTGAPFLSNYDILWVNGTDIKIPVAGAVYPNGLGSRDVAVNLENTLEKRAGLSFESLDKAMAKAREMWAAQSGETSSMVSDVEEASEDMPATSDAGVSEAAPKTGYYKDSAGYAWYYNAEQDYMEAIAAPKGRYTTQPRFSKSSDKGDYTKMKGVLTAANATERASAIANATSSGGEALPASRSSAPPAASPVPTEVANRGAAQTSKKTGIPGWVWWTSGTVLVAGLGVWGAIMIKKNKAAAQ